MMDVRHYGTEEAWLVARLYGIGASELAAILGLSRFASPWSVWQQKVDRVVEPGKDIGPMAEWGHRHEAAIAARFATTMQNDSRFELQYPNLLGLRVEDPGDYCSVWDDASPWMFCSPDRLLTDVHGNWRAVLEIKCAWYDAAKEWNERVPLAYQVQLQQSMICCEVDFGVFAVLLNGYDYRWYVATRHAKFETLLRSRGSAFWESVQAGCPPATDFMPATHAAVAAHYPDSDGTTVELDGGLESAAEELASWQSKAADAKRHVEALRNLFKAAIGDAERGVLPNGRAFSLRPTVDGVRVLRSEKWAQEGESE